MGSMNTLSSGYAASAQRSVSGTTVKDDSSAPRISTSASVRRNRIVALPPEHYVSDGTNGGASSEARGRMMYGFQQSSEGELTVEEGKEVSIIEPDGKCAIAYAVTQFDHADTLLHRRQWLDESKEQHHRRIRSRSVNVCGHHTSISHEPIIPLRRKRGICIDHVTHGIRIIVRRGIDEEEGSRRRPETWR